MGGGGNHFPQFILSPPRDFSSAYLCFFLLLALITEEAAERGNTAATTVKPLPTHTHTHFFYFFIFLKDLELY